MSVKCQQCGSTQADGETFCGDCGAPLTGKDLHALGTGRVSVGTRALASGNVARSKFEAIVSGDGAVPAPSSSGGISIGSRALVSGDIIGSKAETKISGDYNVTHVVNQDETKAVHKCAISGKLVLYSELIECSQCLKRVTSAHFDFDNTRCHSCRDAAELEMKAAIEERLTDDGIIDAEETRELIQIQTHLKITTPRFRELEQLVKETVLARFREDSATGKTAIPGIEKRLKAAAKAIGENNAPFARKLLEDNWEECRDNRTFRDVYLSTLLLCDPAYLKQELLKFQHEELGLDVMRVRVLTALGSPDEARRFLLTNQLKSVAYRNESEWALLGAEVAADLSLFEKDKDLSKFHLLEAEEALTKIPSAFANQGLSPAKFLREYIRLLAEANGNKPLISNKLAQLLPNETSFCLEDLNALKYTVLCAAKIRLLGGYVVRQPSPGPAPSSPPSPQMRPCKHCGVPMNSEVRFCGSCGKAALTVSLFLQDIDMPQYADLFVNNRIDEAIIADLTEQDLKNIGITSIGHRKKIFSAISERKW